MANVLPDRYAVWHSQSRAMHGRPYLSDGSNFVCWVDGMSAAEIAELAAADARRHAESVAAYAAARDAALSAPARADGWRHADCDHYYGICNG